MYIIEFITGSSGNYSYYSYPDEPSVDYPKVLSGSFTTSFYMKWGYENGNYNGWFLENSVLTPEGNFNTDRKNIYAYPK